jgi:hypothetical protein
MLFCLCDGGRYRAALINGGHTVGARASLTPNDEFVRRDNVTLDSILVPRQ